MFIPQPNFGKNDILEEKDFAKNNGLITVVAQDHISGQVLMVASTNEACYRETVETGEAVYWSKSRNERWKKGETSGDIQKVMRISIDCDGDAVIYHVEQLGDGACHSKARSCFFRDATSGKFLMPALAFSVKDKLNASTFEVSQVALPLCCTNLKS